MQTCTSFYDFIIKEHMQDPSSLTLSPFTQPGSGEPTFEKLSRANGTRYWFARDLMVALGYEDWPSFKKALQRAIATCATLGVSVFEHFSDCKRVVKGRKMEDFRLSRYACCLTAMNGDTKLKNVAAAQVYFLSLANDLNRFELPADGAERILIREEITEHEVSLSKSAAAAGVKFFDRFKSAGYRGMYNMEYSELKKLKQIPDNERSLLDFMNKDELAANLFRLTLTEGRLKRDSVRGQKESERVAEQVGRTVRRALIQETGVKPETLPIGPDIREVRRGLKATHRDFSRVDDLDFQRKAETLELYDRAETVHELEAGIVPGCPECLAGSSTSHYGSAQCTSGSLLSGGDVAHCTCDYCAIG